MAAMPASTMLAEPLFAGPAGGRPDAVERSLTRSEEARGVMGLGGLRLTRRGRLVLIALALLVTLPLAGLGGRAVASEPGTPIEVSVHTVAPGETLWGYARQIADPGQDLRDVVAELRELNELASGALQVGQTILVPKV